MRWMIGLLVAALLLAACGASTMSQQDAQATSGDTRLLSSAPEATAAPAGFVSRTMLEDDWPLTVESGTLTCLEGRLLVFVTDNGKTYAVNGTAVGTKRWPQIREIALPAEEPGMIKSLQPLLTRGLPLC
jgi:hypothetical protein